MYQIQNAHLYHYWLNTHFIMTLTKISERIYADTEGTNGGNFGAIVLDDEIVIIDSGMFHHLTEEARELLEKEHQLPVLKLLLTHVHADHVWGAQAFNPVTMISSKQTCSGSITKIEDPRVWPPTCCIVIS